MSLEQIESIENMRCRWINLGSALKNIRRQVGFLAREIRTLMDDPLFAENASPEEIEKVQKAIQLIRALRDSQLVKQTIVEDKYLQEEDLIAQT